MPVSWPIIRRFKFLTIAVAALMMAACDPETVLVNPDGPVYLDPVQRAVQDTLSEGG